MERLGKEREIFDSYLKFLQASKITNEKWIMEIEKIGSIIQKCSSNNKFELLTKISCSGNDIVNYIGADCTKLKELNSYFQKRIQILKNNSGKVGLRSCEEKTLKSEFQVLLEKYQITEIMGVFNNIISILNKFKNNTHSLNQILNEKDSYYELKVNGKNIFKFVEKNKNALENIIKLIEKERDDFKNKLKKKNNFCQIIDNKKILTYFDYLQYRKSRIENEMKNKLNSSLTSISDFLSEREIPVLLLYSQIINKESLSTSINDIVFMISFTFNFNGDFKNQKLIEIFIRDDQMPLSFSQLDKIIKHSTVKLIDYEGGKPNKNFIDEVLNDSNSNISYFLNTKKILEELKNMIHNSIDKDSNNCNYNNTNTDINQSLLPEIKIYSQSEIENYFKSRKDSIIITNEKIKFTNLINNLKILSFNLLLNFQEDEDLTHISNFEKIYKQFIEMRK